MKKYFNRLIKRILLWAFKDRFRVYGSFRLLNGIEMERIGLVKKEVLNDVVKKMQEDGLVEFKTDKITSFLHTCQYRVECRVVIIK